MTQNMHKMKMPTQSQNSQKQSTNSAGELSELKQDLPKFPQGLTANEKEALKQITSISEKSAPRLTNEEKRYLKLQGQVEETLVQTAMLLASLPPTRKDGIVLAARTVPLSDSLMGVAKRDARFCDILERVLAYSVYTALIGEMAIIATAMLANHNIYPLAMFGIKPSPQGPEGQEPELSEEQRAAIFQNLMARGQMFQQATLDERTE